MNPMKIGGSMTLKQESIYYMECIYCSGEMHETTTLYVQEIGSTIVIVKNVPCFKCKKCGEISYIASVAKRLEDITKRLEKAFTEIAVVNYTVA